MIAFPVLRDLDWIESTPGMLLLLTPPRVEKAFEPPWSRRLTGVIGLCSMAERGARAGIL